MLWVAAAAFFVSSAAVLVWNVLMLTLRQSLIPGALLGRVHGTWRTLLWGTMPLGSVIGGLLARMNLALPFLVGGGARRARGPRLLPVSHDDCRMPRISTTATARQPRSGRRACRSRTDPGNAARLVRLNEL